MFGINNTINNNPFLKSMRNLGNRIITGEYEVNEARPLGTNKVWFYSLALEPMEVRSERIIMLAEAYAIFGALFLSGTWVLYEWGSGYGYGGCRYEETSYCSPAVDRAFEVVMAMAITANLFQAMFSSMLWLMSILFSATHRNWVYGCRNLLVLCHHLLIAIFILTIAGVGLGVWAKLAPYWPEVGIALSFLLVIVAYGIYSIANICGNEIALEYYHFPWWFKWGILPFPMLKRGGRQRIREQAEKRAKEVKSRAWKERSFMTESGTSSRSSRSATSIGKLLRGAACNIGRGGFDVSKYEQKLEDDWYNNASELREMSVDVLQKYMPRRLAEEVHNQLAMEKVDEARLSSRHLASGVYEENERRISWNLQEDSD